MTGSIGMMQCNLIFLSHFDDCENGIGVKEGNMKINMCSTDEVSAT